MKDPRYTPIELSARSITALLAVMIIALVMAHMVSQYVGYSMPTNEFWYEIIQRFNLDAEISIPTWFSQTLLFVCAALLALIAAVKFHRKEGYRYHWSGLSLLTLYLSIDEGASLHEIGDKLNLPERIGITSAYLEFEWVLPAAFVVGFIIIIYLKMWWQLPRRTKLLFALAILLFIGGALGVEMISAQYYAEVNQGDFYSKGLLAALEESMEMFGVVIAIYALLDYLRQQKAQFVISLK